MTANQANTKPAMSESTSAKHVSRLVKNAIKGYKNAQEQVQQAALAIIAHAQVYNDCSQAKVLVRGVPARERNSLIGWFLLFSPIGVQMGRTAADDRCKIVQESTVSNFRRNQLLEGAEKFPLYHLDGAKQHPWYTDPAGKNPPPKSLNTVTDFYAIIDRVLKKAIRDAERSKDAENPTYDPAEADEVIKEAEAVRELVNKTRAKRLGKTDPDNEEKSSKPSPDITPRRQRRAEPETALTA